MTEIFNKLVKNGLSPNTYYMLDCLKEGVLPHSFVNIELECKRLQSDNWITKDLQLTEKSTIFTSEIDSYFKKTKKKTSKDLLGDNFIQNIEAYVNIFPNKKLSSGKYARVNPKTLENAFRWFFENYNYSWETIFQATQKYVEEFAANNYEFMRTSQYFLRKQCVDKSWDSDLASYCEYINNPSEDDNVHFEDLIV
jgi:hypothetical protein